jgi:ubiquitin-conjugating enzyme E2 D/E
MTALRRIQHELRELQQENLEGCTAGPQNDQDLYLWDATIVGPSGTPYAGGLFELQIRFPLNYPFAPPNIIFKTKVYHPNISPAGIICIDILKNQWSPALTIGKVLLSISSLLCDPNPRDPLVPAIAQQYERNRAQFEEVAREWTNLYAS